MIAPYTSLSKCIARHFFQRTHTHTGSVQNVNDTHSDEGLDSEINSGCSDFSDSDASRIPESSSESDFDDHHHEIQNVPQLPAELASWAVANSHRISHLALRDLLALLQKDHPNLPKDPRTLLRTFINVEVKDVAGGSYYHFGFVTALKESVQKCRVLSHGDTLKVQINIDG